MNQDRVDELKHNLDNDVYKKMDSLERLREDTLTSTEKLVDILDGYMSKLDDFEIEEEITTMEVVSNDEVDIEVNDDDMLREYNEKIHDFSLETLTELLAKGDVESEQKAIENVDFENKDIDTIIEELVDYQNENESTKEATLEDLDTVTEQPDTDFTQSIVTPENEQISDFDIDAEEEVDIVVEPIESNEDDSIVPEEKIEKKNKKSLEKNKQKKDKKERNTVDLILTIVIVLLFLLVAYNILMMV